MADTSELDAASQWVREELQRRFGVPFCRREVPLDHGGHRIFNAVAEDGSIVAQVSHSSGPTSGGKKPTGKIHGAISSLFFLGHARARRRVLVLTDPAFFAYVTKEVHGAVADDPEMLLVELPPYLARKVREVTTRASEEMS